jgi:RNA polymerase sigma-70 factor (ECF subfamily)
VSGIHKDLLAELYAANRQRLYLFVFALCRNAAVSEDIVQETFARAVLSLPDGHPNFVAWLYTVGKNLCLTELRRQSRILPLDGDGAENTLHSPAPPPQYAAESSEEAAALYAAILLLPDKMRAVITLHYFCGIAFEQIAEILGITAGNVRVLASRARNRLREILTNGDFDNEH